MNRLLPAFTANAGARIGLWQAAGDYRFRRSAVARTSAAILSVVDAPDVVRWRIEPLERPRRGIDERIALALPWLRRLINAAIERLPAGSRVRRAVLTRAVRENYAATNRDDYEASQASLDPDVEFIAPGRGRAGIGFDAVYQGPEGVTSFVKQWKSGFSRFRYEPREIADAGGPSFAVRLGMLGTMRGADTEVRDEYGQVVALKGGRVVRMENFYDWDEALAKLREAAVARRRLDEL